MRIRGQFSEHICMFSESWSVKKSKRTPKLTLLHSLYFNAVAGRMPLKIPHNLCLLSIKIHFVKMSLWKTCNYAIKLELGLNVKMSLGSPFVILYASMGFLENWVEFLGNSIYNATATQRVKSGDFETFNCPKKLKKVLIWLDGVKVKCNQFCRLSFD